MSPILLALADIYRASAVGRGGGGRDFQIDYEQLLRRAGLDDGDARELAEQDLVVAEQSSNGVLRIDRHGRSGLPLKVRLEGSKGERWLFTALGQQRPEAVREELAQFFREAAQRPVPVKIRSQWLRWFEGLAESAFAGRSVQPFERTDGEANRRLLEALHGVVEWPHESLIRYASVQIAGNSKALEAMRPRLESALREMTGELEMSLESFGIASVPRTVTMHGPIKWHLAGGVVDVSVCEGPVTLSAVDLQDAILELGSGTLLTVENESVFLELVRRNPGVLLVLTSFPGAATCQLLGCLPRSMRCFHFGDTDPAGFDILRDLRVRTGRRFLPFLMEPRPGLVAFSATEGRTLKRLVHDEMLADVHPWLVEMRERGSHGAFEQEGLPLDGVLEELSKLHREELEG